MDDMKKLRAAAEAFCRENLAACCNDEIEWQDTGLLCNGKLRELSALCEKYTGKQVAMQVAQSLVKREAMIAARRQPDAVPASAEVAALIQALRPFAEAYKPELRTQTDDLKFQAFLDANTVTPPMTMGDFRRAHVAIRALAEVVPEQRGDSTNEQGRADALDAQRYRFLRDESYEAVIPHGVELNGKRTAWITKLHTGDTFDQAIDAAIAAESAAQGGKE